MQDSYPVNAMATPTYVYVCCAVDNSCKVSSTCEAPYNHLVLPAQEPMRASGVLVAACNSQWKDAVKKDCHLRTVQTMMSSLQNCEKELNHDTCQANAPP